jgi:hypothetical protein
VATMSTVSKRSMDLACRACEHKIHPKNVLSRHPPSCECGNYDYPHSHRGRPSHGLVIRHLCHFCSLALTFDEDGNVDATASLEDL